MGAFRELRFAVFAVITCYVFALTACQSAPLRGTRYQDPGSRFSFVVHPSLLPSKSVGAFASFRLEDPLMQAYVVVEDTVDPNKALQDGLRRIGMSPENFTTTGRAILGVWELTMLGSKTNNSQIAVAASVRGESTFLLLAFSEQKFDGMPPSEIMQILKSWSFSPLQVERELSVGDLTNLIDSEARNSGASVSVLVERNGAVIFEHVSGNLAGIGSASAKGAAYQWGSITKIVTAIAVMQLVEDNRVSLDEVISNWVPELREGNRITIRQLLTHTSGLRNSEVKGFVGLGAIADFSLERTLGRYPYISTTLAYEPGTKVEYNNWNYLLLGLVVERASKIDFIQYCRQNILEPANLKKTSYRHQDLTISPALAKVDDVMKANLTTILAAQGLQSDDFIDSESSEGAFLKKFNIMPAWGGLQGPVEDLPRLTAIFIQGGTVGRHQILKKQTIDLMLSHYRLKTGEESNRGLGWIVSQDGLGRYAEHSGGGPGISADLQFYPDLGLSIAIAGNSTSYRLGAISRMIVDLVEKDKL